MLSKLRDIIGMDIGFKQDVKHDFFKSEKDGVHEIAESESELEINLKKIRLVYNKFEPHDFLEKAKKAFEIVFNAYASGDKKSLKNLLKQKIYNAFSLAIDDRLSRKETLDGTLIRFVDAEIIDAQLNDDNIFITIKFLTEQVNVLKSDSGEILEGNSDFIESRTDVWLFSRKNNSQDSRWFLHEINRD